MRLGPSVKFLWVGGGGVKLAGEVQILFPPPLLIKFNKGAGKKQKAKEKICTHGN